MARRDAPAGQLDAAGRGRAGLGGLLLDERPEVGVGDVLLGVGERHDLAVDGVEGRPLDVVTELAQLALESAAAGELADGERGPGQADRLRGHDLVGQRVLEHAVLVDARLVGEGVAADDRLVGLDDEAGQVADQAAGGRDLLRGHAAGEVRELRRPRAQRHDDLFQRGVAGPLAEPVDGHLDLSRAGLDGGQRVGRGQAEVVVAVDADDGARSDPFDDRADERPELRWDGVADRVGDVDRGGTGVDDRLVDAQQELRVGARGILGGELDLRIRAERLAPVADPLDRGGERLLAGGAELVLEVDVARRDEDVEVRSLGDADGLDRPLRVAVAAAREGGHGHRPSSPWRCGGRRPSRRARRPGSRPR